MWNTGKLHPSSWEKTYSYPSDAEVGVQSQLPFLFTSLKTPTVTVYVTWIQKKKICHTAAALKYQGWFRRTTKACVQIASRAPFGLRFQLVKEGWLWPLKGDWEYDNPCSDQIKTHAAKNSNNVFQCYIISSGTENIVLPGSHLIKPKTFSLTVLAAEAAC